MIQYWIALVYSSTQLKTIRIVRDGDSSKDTDAQLSQIKDDGEKKYRSETPIAKL